MKAAAPGTLPTTVYRLGWRIFLFQEGRVDKAIYVHGEILEDKLAICRKTNTWTLQDCMT